MIALTGMDMFNIRVAKNREYLRTILKIRCPSLPLISGTTYVVYAPFHAPITARWYGESMFDNTHRL